MQNIVSRISNLFPYADLVLLHFPAGVMAALVTLIFSQSPHELIRSATDIGIMKEVWDFGRTKRVTLQSFLELLSTALGGVAVAVWFI